MSMIADRKCGTCRNFRVRPNEITVAQHAKPMAYCGPGRYCHGGPVRGWCSKLGRQAESTDLPCAEGTYQAGGPTVRRVGEQTAVVAGSASRENVAHRTQDMIDSAVESLSADGNILVFAITGAMVLGGSLLKQWSWEESETTGLALVCDEDGHEYPYKVLPGGRHAVIYLPTGRTVEHRITAAAARDPQQLADEVYALVLDLYQSRG